MALRNGRAEYGFWQRRRAQFNELKRRVNDGAEFWIVDHIWDACTGGPDEIEWLPLTDEQLCEIARGVTRQTVSAVINRLLGLGWIERRRSRRDRRSWEYAIRPDRFADGPLWAAHTCSPRAAVSPAAESVKLTLHSSQVECTFGADCPYLLKTLNTNTSSSSSYQNEATTTEDRHAADSPAAVPETPFPEPRIANPDPNGRTAPRASVRPSARTERKRAVSRSRQQHTDNGGGRGDGGRKPGDDSLKKPEFRNVAGAAETCPSVVAEAVAACGLGIADQAYLDDLWRDANAGARITPDELAHCIRAKADTVRRTARTNPLGLLRTSVLNLCDPVSLAGIRRDMAKYAAALAAQREREAESEARMEREMRACYAETNDEAERERMRAMHPFLRE